MGGLGGRGGVAEATEEGGGADWSTCLPTCAPAQSHLVS